MPLAIVLFVATRAAAQPGPYATVGGGFVYAAEGREESPYLAGVLGGPTFNIQAAAGAAGRKLAVEGEFSFHGEITDPQRNRVSKFDTHHRDVLVSALARFNPAGW